MQTPDKAKPSLADLGLDGPIVPKPLLLPVENQNGIPPETTRRRPNAMPLSDVTATRRWPSWMGNVWVQNLFWVCVIVFGVYYLYSSIMHPPPTNYDPEASEQVLNVWGYVFEIALYAVVFFFIGYLIRLFIHACRDLRTVAKSIEDRKKE